MNNRTTMKRKTIAVLQLIMACMFTGCSVLPRVVADASESLPSRSADHVMIYEEEDTVPVEARAIGTVKVTDGGMTPAYKCLYGNMLALAVKQTAASGGNALHIDKHKTPSIPFGSSCHRIWGTMYLMPDSMVDADTPSILQQLEEENDAELLSMQKKYINRSEKMFRSQRNIFKVSGGLAWITSDFETNMAVYKRKRGYALSADYQHLFLNGLGVGLTYLHFGADFVDGFNLRMHYVGPSAVFALPIGDKWKWDMSLSVGYTKYTEEYYDFSVSESRVGVLYQTGIEYMLSRHFGVGFQVNAFSVGLKRPEGIDTSKYDFYGVRHIDTMLGLRYYF